MDIRKFGRTLVAAVLTLTIMLSVTGGTIAWFTDSVTSNANKIESGTLNVDLELLDKTDGTTWSSIKEDKTALFSYDKWEPGYALAKVLRVANKGTLALKWTANITTDETSLSTLANVIDVYVSDISAYPTSRTELDSWKKVGSLSDLANVADKQIAIGTIAANDTADAFAIALKMRESAGNEYQGLTLGDFDIRVLATQMNSESDSFGSDYDAEADYDSDPAVPPTNLVATAAHLKEMLTKVDDGNPSDSIVFEITEDITLAQGEVWTPINRDSYTGINNVTINGNGHTISGLNAPLFGDCHFGNVSITINGLTLEKSIFDNKGYNGLGSGAFIAAGDNCKSITLVDCHLKDSAITATDDFTGIGGLVGYSSSDLTITNCSVSNTTINGAKQSAGAIAGHVSAGHNTQITNAKVTDCTIKGEKANKTGYIVGTANNGQTTITTSAECANNTVFDVANSNTIYGRFVPNGTGTLTVNGVSVSN
ncbi:MAG: SipW-dependent-type signal peptide-containing protein [Clostridia bacterium]|nr:SipW-dependent-type signal peptide-containing protein [Clostridia bacterium]